MTNTKTILKVEQSYDNSLVWEFYKEDVKNISEGLDIHVEHSNTTFENVIPTKGYTDDYKNQMTINCIGYVQSEWDRYTIYYNVLNDDIKSLAKELKKVFTHKNQYSIEEIEELDSGHSKTITHYTITIMHIEFPEEEDIEKEIKEQHDLEYDQVLFNL